MSSSSFPASSVSGCLPSSSCPAKGHLAFFSIFPVPTLLTRIHYRVRLDMRPQETYHEGARDKDKMEGNGRTNQEAAAAVQVKDKKTHGGSSSRNEGGKNSSTEEERPSSALDTGRREEINSQMGFQLLEGKKSRA